jgi:hypothetical protein
VPVSFFSRLCSSLFLKVGTTRADYLEGLIRGDSTLARFPVLFGSQFQILLTQSLVLAPGGSRFVPACIPGSARFHMIPVSPLSVGRNVSQVLTPAPYAGPALVLVRISGPGVGRVPGHLLRDSGGVYLCQVALLSDYTRSFSGSISTA